MSSKYLGYSIIVVSAFFISSFIVFTYKLTALEVGSASWVAGSIVLGAYIVMVSLLGVSLKLRNGRDLLALGAIIMSVILAFGANLIVELAYLGKNFITSLACPTYSPLCLGIANIIAYPAALALLTTGLIGTYTLTYLLIKEIEATYWIKDYGSLLILTSGTLIIAASVLVVIRLVTLGMGIVLPSEALVHALLLATNTVLYISAVLFTLGLISCCYLLSRELIKSEALE